MTEFFNAVDIANRALQHCGVTRIDPLKGFTEVSRNSSEAAFAYGKVRRAELQTNPWTFATRRTALRAIDDNTMLLAPALWGPYATYFVGSIVSDQQNNLWISRSQNNLGNDPLNSLLWEPYFGPLTVSLYATGQSFFAGEVAYTAPGNGTYRVYLSLQSSNADDPASAVVWSATGVYSKNQVTSYLGVSYMSLIDLNTNNLPTLAPALFNVATTYAAAAKVGGSDGLIYQSVGSGNIGHDPTLDPTGTYWTNTGLLNPWTTVFVSGTNTAKWLQIGGTEFPFGVGLTTLDITYPLGVGPSSESATRNVFKLPAGYLREASQNPKGTASPLGGPSGITYNDWNIENGYLITGEMGPIPFRFIADITDVRFMSDLFCESLAARLALELCEPLTQSSAKLGTIAKIYQEWVDRARGRNAIEVSYDDPPDDDYISVRY